MAKPTLSLTPDFRAPDVTENTGFPRPGGTLSSMAGGRNPELTGYFGARRGTE